jgi:RNA polymerase sigma-70 factor (ECF subfamily)
MNSSVTIRLRALAMPEENAKTSAVPALHAVLGAGVPDEVLLANICEGDMQSLGHMFQRYARLVRGVALRILRDRAEADDLLQEVFLFIHRRCQVFDATKCSARSWIVQMTYQRAIDRRRYLQSRHFYTRLNLDGFEDVADSCKGREEEDLWRSLVGNTTVGGLLDTLNQDQRNTLVLYFFEGCAFAEIAEKLNQSLGNIRNHYYRGLEKLRKQIFPGKSSGRNGYGNR